MKNSDIQILVVEDDASMADLLTTILKGYTVHTTHSMEEARGVLNTRDIHITLLDIRLPDGNGIDLLRSIKENGDRGEVILISSVRDIPTVVQAMKLGAYDYINKDFDYEDVHALVKRVVQKLIRERELLYLRGEILKYTDTEFLIGKSQKMKQVEEIIQKAAQVSATILVGGGSGTGKELVARRIHSLSPKARKPFVTVNLAAIPPELIESTLFGHERGAFTGAYQTHYGKFELANGGTLFLDEISELRYDLQVKLLRAIQESTIERVGSNRPIRINVRLIAATNRNLETMVKENRFRGDLYYRLNVVPIHLPCLSERAEDIPEFVTLFIKKYAKQFHRTVQSMNTKALAILQSYHWTGNIRELQNLIERLVAVNDKEILTERDIPIEYLVYQFDELKKQGEEDLIKAATDVFERNFILNVLEKEDWNQTRTSERLGIHRRTLEYKIKKLKLDSIIEARR